MLTPLPGLDAPDGLSVLAAQAIPSICERLGITNSLPREALPTGLDDGERRVVEEERNRILNELLSRKVGWWDIFDASDIGRERDEIARRFVTSDSKVLDLGCGRGFFTFACARVCRQVVSVDVMDGEARRGWWSDYLRSANALGLHDDVCGIRADSEGTPFTVGSFDLAASVHAIRNFGGRSQIKKSVREAHRVLREGGKFVVAESRIDPKRERTYSAFYDIRVKMGWETSLPSRDDLVRWFKEAGFSRIDVEVMDTALHYAPVDIPANAIPKENARLLKDYGDAVRFYEYEGMESPPILLVSGHKAG